MIRREAIVGLVLLSMVACTESSAPEIPGLDPTEEVELVEVEPGPSDDSFVWSHALQVEDLPPVNVGHPTSEFLEDAARVGGTQRIISVWAMRRGPGVALSKTPMSLRSRV